jgi:hypothetical protein
MRMVTKGVKFIATSYTFFSLLVSGIYAITVTNWPDDACIDYPKIFLDKLLQFGLAEFVVFPILLELFVFVNITNEFRIWNQIAQYAMKAILCSNLIFQTLWLMVLITSFQDTIDQVCSLSSKISVYSKIGIAFHFAIVLTSIVVILILLLKFVSQLLRRTHDPQSNIV